MASIIGLKMLQAHFAGKSSSEMFKIDFVKVMTSFAKDTRNDQGSITDITKRVNILIKEQRKNAKRDLEKYETTDETGIPKLYNGLGSQIVSTLIAILLQKDEAFGEPLYHLLYTMFKEATFGAQLRVHFFDEAIERFGIKGWNYPSEGQWIEDIFPMLLLLNPRIRFSKELKGFFDKTKDPFLSYMAKLIERDPFNPRDLLPPEIPEHYMLRDLAIKTPEQLRDYLFFDGAPMEKAKERLAHHVKFHLISFDELNKQEDITNILTIVVQEAERLVNVIRQEVENVIKGFRDAYKEKYQYFSPQAVEEEEKLYKKLDSIKRKLETSPEEGIRNWRKDFEAFYDDFKEYIRIHLYVQNTPLIFHKKIFKEQIREELM